MSGPFYGSLAASASVFVAILTALLVNNYVQIKSDRRQTNTELDRVEEELTKFENQQETYQDTIDDLTGKRERRYKENARERVQDFLKNQVPSQISTPIEKLDIDTVYHQLSNYHGFDSPQEMEQSDENYHRQLLEDSYNQIEQSVLQDITSSFAKTYLGTGERSKTKEIESDALKEIIEETSNEEDSEDHDTSTPEDIEVHAEGVDEDPDPVQLEEVIQDYKEEYNLQTLEPETKQALEHQYNEIIDQSQIQKLQGTIQEIRENRTTFPFNDVFDSPDISTGLGIQEKSRLEEARKDLTYAENQIKTLERRQNRLQDELSGLKPEDLVPTLVANVATIILSVVVPITAYLLFTTETQIIVPNWLWILALTEVYVFLSWLAGLGVVFESIHARINDREPKAHSLYKWLKDLLSRD